MNTPPSIADLRKSYEMGALDESAVAADPLDQLKRWLDEAIASGITEPNAMTLATVGANGRPSSRIVLIKGLDTRGIVWFTNYESRKARDLAAQPCAALQFHWIAQERQVRVEGRVEKTSAQESDAYFASRPLDSRIGAWASPQSSFVASRAELEARQAAFAAQYGDAVPRPPHWGGYRLVPDYLEFWQGRPSRLHDRITYLRDAAGGWQLARLAP
jgi:pyridoxamine 5'-phosphate oxidase